MATKFSDIAKPAKDLLSDDYTTKFVLKSKNKAGPVTVTIETEQDKSGALTSKIGTKFSYAKFNVDKGQFKADGGRVLETSLALSPELKLSFKADKGADLGIDYKKGSLVATGKLDVMEMSKFSTSACFGLPSGLILGADATYTLAGNKGLTAFNYGFAYGSGPMRASITATSKNSFAIGLLYKVNPDLSLASETIHSQEKLCNIVAIGGAYKVPTLGTIKAKMGTDGILNACLSTEVVPKVTLVASGSVNPSDLSSFKPGIQISM
jgi:voltage-dependent anion channel protein 2